MNNAFTGAVMSYARKRKEKSLKPASLKDAEVLHCTQKFIMFLTIFLNCLTSFLTHEALLYALYFCKKFSIQYLITFLLFSTL